MPQKDGSDTDPKILGPDGFRPLFVRLVAGLPPRQLVAFGRALGDVAYILDRRHLRIVKRNLRFAYPDWPQSKIQVYSRRVFENAAITFVEIFHSVSLSRQDIRNRVRVRGNENLLQAVGSPKGAIMISAHLGNWEMAHLFASSHMLRPPVLVARRIRPEIVNRLTQRIRTRFGNIVLDKFYVNTFFFV